MVVIFQLKTLVHSVAVHNCLCVDQLGGTSMWQAQESTIPHLYRNSTNFGGLSLGFSFPSWGFTSAIFSNQMPMMNLFSGSKLTVRDVHQEFRQHSYGLVCDAKSKTFLIKIDLHHLNWLSYQPNSNSDIPYQLLVYTGTPQIGNKILRSKHRSKCYPTDSAPCDSGLLQPSHSSCVSPRSSRCRRRLKSSSWGQKWAMFIGRK